MARGGKRGRGIKRKGPGGKRNDLSKKQKSHYKEFGEAHPADERSSSGRERFKTFRDETMKKERAASSSESEEEAPNDYQQLVASIATTSGQTDSDITDEESDEEEPRDKSGDERSEDEDSDEDGNDIEQDQEESGDNPVESDNEQDDASASPDKKRKAKKGEKAQDSATADKDSNVGEEPGLEKSDYRNEQYESDGEQEDEPGKEKTKQKYEDTFSTHFEHDLEEKTVERLGDPSAWTSQQVKLPHLGRGSCTWPELCSKPVVGGHIEKDLEALHVRPSISSRIFPANKFVVKAEVSEEEPLTALQSHLFKQVNQYQDIYYPERSHKNGEEIRLVYCLHALNHVLKTRSKVIGHNTQIKSKHQDLPDEFRDQGLTRPKVLIVLPFKDAALQAVRVMSRLMFDKGKINVQYKKKFKREFSDPDKQQQGNRPEDYEATFAGNTDDNFLLGVGMGKKSLKLYTDIYASDIILASPLALRTAIGAEGESDRDFDFLSSIEVLIFDQTDVYLMQNWDHVLHLMRHLHLQPEKSHGVDFSRVRMWALNGWSKYYRQTLVFSDIITPEINALFNKHCHNYVGKVSLQKPPSTGSICQILAQLPQVFHRLSVNSYSELADARFEFFKSKVLPQYKEQVMSHTLIYVPSYFDFVRLRNYFRKEELDFIPISEYSKDKHVSRARTKFYHGKVHTLLYTERFHFYRRYKIRGIRHLIFYDLPAYAHFYSEICNLIKSDPRHSAEGAQDTTCTVLYSRYDVHKLAAIVGHDRATHMVNAEKGVHMFVTGET